jgi:hypothetical protein
MQQIVYRFKGTKVIYSTLQDILYAKLNYKHRREKEIESFYLTPTNSFEPILA